MESNNIIYVYSNVKDFDNNFVGVIYDVNGDFNDDFNFDFNAD